MFSSGGFGGGVAGGGGLFSGQSQTTNNTNLAGSTNLFGGATASTTGPDPNTNQSTEVPNPPTDTISALAWSPVANHLAAASWDKTVRVWEIQSSPAAPQPPVQQLSSFGLSTASTASNTAAGTSPLVNINNIIPKFSYNHEAPALCVCFSADGSCVFSGGCDGKIRMYNLAAPAGGAKDNSNGGVVIGQHDAPVSCIGFSADIRMVISASWDKTMRFWNATSPTPVATLNLPERAYAMDIKSPLLVIAMADRFVNIYNLQTLQTNPNPYKSIQSSLKMQTRCIAAFPDRAGFSLGSIEGRCSIAYVEDAMKDKAFTFKCHRSNTEAFAVNCVDFHPTYGSVLTAGSDGTCIFWDKENKVRLRAMNSCHYPITAAKFSTQGDMLAYAVGYDWSKGFEGNAFNSTTTGGSGGAMTQIPKKIFIHRISEGDVKGASAKPGNTASSAANSSNSLFRRR